jgi:hypothetical protein
MLEALLEPLSGSDSNVGIAENTLDEEDRLTIEKCTVIMS